MRSTWIAVALAGVLLIAGCTGSPGGGGVPTATDVPTTDEPTATTDDPTPTPTPTVTATTTTDGFYNAFRFESVSIGPAAIAREIATPIGDLDPEKRDLALAVLANGSATDVRIAHGDRIPGSPGTLVDGEYLRRNGTYYRIDATVTDRKSGEGYPFSLLGPLRERHDDYDAATEEAVSVDSLTPTQRDLFEHLVPPASRREDATVHANRYYLPPAGGGLNESGWLDDESHYVREGGDLFRVRYDDGRTPTVTRMRIRYHLEPVADSDEAFVEPRLEEYVVNITDQEPSEPARSVILSTIENRTFEWEGTTRTRPRGVELANDWLGEHSPDGSYAYVRYEGELYRIQVTQIIE